MTYEAEIDLRNANTSDALLVELIGCDRRVLDIGCQMGEFGRVLKHRGCRVAGVESDHGAAEVAERVLDEILIGDVDDLELVKHFGKDIFDVVVFRDVLQHLADPVAVLRKVRPLLSMTGSVVASIPNVAHGSIRLALLNGRFDSRPLGLPDSTPLRFFTRGSVHGTFREAGLVPVDMRRTTAGLFDTEIGVRRADFDEGIIDAVEGDPESMTYQFVLRAVPEDSPDAIGTEQTRGAQRVADTMDIGLCAPWEPCDLRTALAVRVTYAEIARRLPGARIRSFSFGASFRPSPHDGGLTVEALGPWSSDRASRLASEVDCIVVAGDIPETDEVQRRIGREAGQVLLEGPGSQTEINCAILSSPVGLPGEALPDPLLLVPRLLQREALARRLNFLCTMGWFPVDGPAVAVALDGALLPHAGAVARALDAAVAGTGAGIVLVPSPVGDAGGADAAVAVSGAMGTTAYRIPYDAVVDDVVAVIANAAALASCSSWATALGLAYDVPVVDIDMADKTPLSRLAALLGNGTAVAAGSGALAGHHRDEGLSATPAAVATMQAKLDVHFDGVAAIAATAAAGRRHRPEGRPPLPPAEYVAALELAHRRMQERLAVERRAVAEHLGALQSRHEAELGRSQAELHRLRAEHHQLGIRLRETLVDRSSRGERHLALRSEIDRVTAELKALQGTRILRLLRPVRAIYARLRGGRL